MREDTVRVAETTHVGVAVADYEPVRWRCSWTIEKRLGDDLTVDPFEVVHGDGNLLMYGGASCLWEALIGNGTATSAQTLTYFNSSNAYIGVGDSNTAEAATQTDLQASSNKTRKAATPTHTDGTSSGSASVTFAATFSTSDSNYVWAEWAIFNSASGGRMLNRKVASLGTKTSAASWSLSVTLTLS
ncbi:hypothetical protein [Frankia sp. AgW1.1]|uniref:hypothetical protein n=1 Tax=Frankia sp. AgW1.1 TaxID=1836971 RepID=UPI001932F093|nr:hypothetical protein [Frankia sp. AgW1.1]MBL7487088.1 hypothetical protein [Frankia sp. AgW1.1]